MSCSRRRVSELFKKESELFKKKSELMVNFNSD